MTVEEKKAKILAAAATFGAHCDLHWNVAVELKNEGLIIQKATKTPVGNTVFRWFLA